MLSETIVALATATGRSSVAIVRVSGEMDSIQKIMLALLKKVLSPRYAVYTPFYTLSDKNNPLIDRDDAIIDQGIALYFPAPHSFTGENVLEFHTHGGIIIANTLIKEILKLNTRLAKPGEFTERAFLNNKIDLVQAEAIADLIDASSEQAARAAMRSLQGEFSKQVHLLVHQIIQIRSYIEASIDFVEEEIDFLTQEKIKNTIIKIIYQINLIKISAQQGSLLREGIIVVIAGAPNAGKSSLLNQLSGQDTAIVTSIAGTTRDILREKIQIDGMPIQIIDTAGLRESEDIIEQEGIRRAKCEIEKADMVLWITDISDSRHKADKTDPKIAIALLARHSHLIKIKNKIDLTQEKPEIKLVDNYAEIALSAKTGHGIELLRQYIKDHIGLKNTPTENIFLARQRHIHALECAESFLKTGVEQLEQSAPELLAEELRQAQISLNKITGEFTSDDLLGKIFSDFCIGK